MNYDSAVIWLSEVEWQPRQRAHQARVDEITAGRLQRLDRRQSHPTEDFLWEYYSFRPGQLRRWSPGIGVVLTGEVDDFLSRKFFSGMRGPDGEPAVMVDADSFLAKRGGTVEYVRDLLDATSSRSAQLACFCLHEWAMVYELPDGAARHPLPLRLGEEGTDAVVRSHPLRCTHFDAYRFFTPAARPLLPITPTRETQRELEQPGCLHAIMDLYKWCYKLSPAIGSELVLDAFLLAHKVRQLDMASSPYDATDYGLAPVRIETAEGKAEFVARQRELVAEGAALRARILLVCQEILSSGAHDSKIPAETLS